MGVAYTVERAGGRAEPREVVRVDLACGEPNEVGWTMVDGIVRATHNSRGGRIHASAQGIRNFWRWFGDSKAVDALKRPLVLFHGTVCWSRDGRSLGDVTTFDRLASVRIVRRAHSIDTVGTWCTDEPGMNGAEKYAYDGAIYALYLRTGGVEVMSFGAMVAKARKLGKLKANDKVGEAAVDRMRSWLGGRGVESVRLERDDGPGEFENQTAWIALGAGQLKSATGNSGSFCSASDSICD